VPGPPVPPLFPYTTLFRSQVGDGAEVERVAQHHDEVVGAGVDVLAPVVDLVRADADRPLDRRRLPPDLGAPLVEDLALGPELVRARKSTRLNSSHSQISYA